MLSNTGYVILGFLARGPMSGYEIKQKIDVTTRFFFAASYGQIYPELKKLESQKLISGEEKRRGQRARTEYSITESGRRTLKEWIDEAIVKVEFRDEGLLRLFFSDENDPAQRLAIVRAMRDERAATLATFRAIGEELLKDNPIETHEETLDFGIGLYEYAIDWCDQRIKELDP